MLKRIRHMEKPDLILNIIILLGAVLNLFPLYWLITSSFKTSAAIYKMPPDWFPTTFNIGNYRDLFVGSCFRPWPRILSPNCSLRGRTRCIWCLFAP